MLNAATPVGAALTKGMGLPAASAISLSDLDSVPMRWDLPVPASPSTMAAPVVVTIDISVTKIIRILEFNCMLVAGASSKCLKGLIELYISWLLVLKLIIICIHILIVIQFRDSHMVIRVCM